jgi:hypothetical protein
LGCSGAVAADEDDEDAPPFTGEDVDPSPALRRRPGLSVALLPSLEAGPCSICMRWAPGGRGEKGEGVHVSVKGGVRGKSTLRLG